MNETHLRILQTEMCVDLIIRCIITSEILFFHFHQLFYINPGSEINCICFLMASYRGLLLQQQDRLWN